MEYFILIITAIYFGINGWCIGSSDMQLDSFKNVLWYVAFALFGTFIFLALVVFGFVYQKLKKQIEYLKFWYWAIFTDKYQDLPDWKIRENEKYFKNSKGWDYLKQKYDYTLES